MLVGAGRTVIKTLESRERLKLLKSEVESLRQEMLALEGEWEYKKSEEFLEKEARDKLSMVKEGEKIVILPEKFKVLGEQTQEEKKSQADIPAWKQWWDLFFGKED